MKPLAIIVVGCFLLSSQTTLAQPTWQHLIQQAEECYAQSEYTLAAELYEQAAEQLWELDSVQAYAFQVAEAAKAWRKVRDLDRAEALLTQSMAKVEEAVGTENRAFEALLRQRARVYETGSRIDEAIRAYTRLVPLRKKLFPQPDKSTIHAQDNLGILYIRQGDYHEAIRHIRASLEGAKELQPKLDEPVGMGTIYYNLASAHLHLGQREDAIGYYGQAIDWWSRDLSPTHTYLQYAWHSMGQMHLELGNRDSALHCFVQESYIREANGELEGLPAMEQEHQAKDQRQSGLYAAALENYREAMEQRKQALGEDHPATVGCLTAIGDIYLLLGDPEAAWHEAQSAMQGLVPGFTEDDVEANPDDFLTVTSAAELLKAFRVKTEALQAVYDSTGIKSWLEAAHRAVMDAVPLVHYIRQLQYAEGSKLYWAERINPLLETGLQINQRLFERTGLPAYAFDGLRLAELGKALLLQEALITLQAEEDGALPADWISEQRDLKQQLHVYEQLLVRERNKCALADSARLTVMEEEIYTLRNTLTQRLLELEKNQPDYHRLLYADPWPGEEAIQAQRTRERGILEFFWGEESVWLIGLLPEDIWFEKLGPPDSIQQLIEPFLTQLQPNSFREQDAGEAARSYQTRAMRLLNTLVPEQAALPQQLVVVPDGPIWQVPLEALVRDEQPVRGFGQLDYLVHHHTVVYQQSLQNWLQQESSRRSGRLAYLGFAPDYTGASGPRANAGALRYNQDEVRMAQTVLGGSAYLGAEARKQQFLEEAAKARIVHLAMHAEMDSVNPLHSGLLFGNDDPLHLYELYNQRLNASLAILSACNTGSGPWQRGEGIMSLARGFYQAGCPSVVMTLWQVDDGSAAQLMEQLVGQLRQEGMPLDEALQHAKLNYLATADQMAAHPYFWAGYTLNGSAQPLPLPRPGWPRWVLIIGGGCLVLVLAGLWVRKRRSVI